MLYDEIVKRYRACESMKQVARELEVNHGVVRRVLITEGLISDERTEKAIAMRREGASLEEIAEALHVKRNTVFNYIPYPSTCRRDWPKTKNAERIQRCRERKREKEEQN